MTECRGANPAHNAEHNTISKCRNKGRACCSANQNGIPGVDVWGASVNIGDACAYCFWGIKQTPAPTTPTGSPTRAPSYRFTKECGGGEMTTAGDSDVYDTWVDKIKNHAMEPKAAADATDHLTVGDYQPNYAAGRRTLELKPYGGGDHHGRILVGYSTAKKVVRAKCYNRHVGNTQEMRQIMQPLADTANAAHYIDYGDADNYDDYGEYGNYQQAAHVYAGVDRQRLPHDYVSYNYAGHINNNNLDNAVITGFGLVLSLIMFCLLIAVTFVCGSVFGYGSAGICSHFRKEKQTDDSSEVDATYNEN